MKSPDYVYKYRCWDDEHHRRIITHGEIYFTSAASFNDPFDCSIPIQYTLMSKEEMLKYAEDFIKERLNFDISQMLSQSKMLKEIKNQMKLSQYF